MTKPRLTAAERELLDPGFRRVYRPAKESQTLPPAIPAGTGKLSGLKPGARVKPKAVTVRRQVAPPPPAMREAELIRAMQTRGVGRPATYAETLETLLERGYAGRDRAGGLRSTELGQRVLGYLVESFPTVFDLDFTARMETRLDDIAAGRADYLGVLTEFWAELSSALEGGRG